MKMIRILYKGIYKEQIIAIDDNDMADKLFSDIFNARVKKRDVLLIEGVRSKRFISPKEIADCSLEISGD